MNCDQQPIRAHSIQNAKVLELLASDGHVIGFKKRIDAVNGPTIYFDKIGRNEATTFTGLCSEHDRTIFADIDTQQLDTKNKKQLFLYAYRAACRELHAVMEAGLKLQLGYQQRVKLGLSPGNQPCDAGMMATSFLMNSYETWEYRATNFDQGLVANKYDLIQHDVIHFSNQAPTIAACVLFSLDDLIVGDQTVRVALNIVPTSDTETVAIFSYDKRSASPARKALKTVLSSQGLQQKYELSKRLLNHCENFVISPQFFGLWDEEKKNVIKDYYTSTIFENNLAFNDPRLNLFIATTD